MDMAYEYGFEWGTIDQWTLGMHIGTRDDENEKAIGFAVGFILFSFYFEFIFEKGPL